MKILCGTPPKTDISQSIVKAVFVYGGEVLAQKNARKIVIFLNNKNEKNLIKMLQILSNYGNINNIGEPKIKGKMKTITITEEQVKQYKLPAKAVGDWSIVEKGDGYSLLHRLKKDGALGSDRPNNKIKIDSEVLNKLSASDTKAITGKTENGDTVVIAKTKHIDNEPKVDKPTESNVAMGDEEMAIGTRKSRWIAQLVEQMKTEPFTAGLLEKMGDSEFVKQVLEDTNPERQGGKAYSSISSAMRVWNKRIRRGEYAY